MTGVAGLLSNGDDAVYVMVHYYSRVDARPGRPSSKKFQRPWPKIHTGEMPKSRTAHPPFFFPAPLVYFLFLFFPFFLSLLFAHFGFDFFFSVGYCTHYYTLLHYYYTETRPAIIRYNMGARDAHTYSSPRLARIEWCRGGLELRNCDNPPACPSSCDVAESEASQL